MTKPKLAGDFHVSSSLSDISEDRLLELLDEAEIQSSTQRYPGDIPTTANIVTSTLDDDDTTAKTSVYACANAIFSYRRTGVPPKADTSLNIPVSNASDTGFLPMDAT